MAENLAEPRCSLPSPYCQEGSFKEALISRRVSGLVATHGMVKDWGGKAKRGRTAGDSKSKKLDERSYPKDGADLRERREEIPLKMQRNA